MARPIDAVKTAEIISEHFGISLDDLCDVFAAIPTEDVQPVVHGMWVREVNPYNDITYRCSSCSRDWWADNWSRWNYCPECGARMDGEE